MTEDFMPLLETSAHGVYIIAATPFTDDGAVDTASLDRLMDFYVGCGIMGVTVLGIMGEAPKLTHAEAVALTRQVVRRVNGLPVIVGASAPGFAQMAALAKDVMDAGAGGVMIAPPGTLKTDDQIVTYFANAVEAIGADVHDVFDRHLPLLRYEQQPGMLGLAVRKYILKRRGAIASDAQRKPGIKLSTEAIAEIEFLIARLERNN